MKVKYAEYVRHPITSEYSLYGQYTAEGDTKVDCFKQIYDSERAARYCSGHRYQVEAHYDAEYRDWKQHGVTLEMYYGHATVD